MDPKVRKFLRDLAMVTLMITATAVAGILAISTIIWVIVRMVTWIVS